MNRNCGISLGSPGRARDSSRKGEVGFCFLQISVHDTIESRPCWGAERVIYLLLIHALPLLLTCSIAPPRTYHDAANELHALLHPPQRSPWQRIDMTIKCVVIGAGPVGALAGLYAARRGWDVEIYDLRPGRFRGIGIEAWALTDRSQICEMPQRRLSISPNQSTLLCLSEVSMPFASPTLRNCWKPFWQRPSPCTGA